MHTAGSDHSDNAAADPIDAGATQPDIAQRLKDLSPAKRALLEQRLQKQQASTPAQTISRQPRTGVDDTFPLSFSQERLWFLDQLSPGNTSYNIFGAVRLTGLLDVDALQKTLDAIVARHEVLRARYVTQGEETVQIIGTPYRVTLPISSPERFRGSDQEVESDDELILRLARVESRQPFRLSLGPLMYNRLLRISETDHVLFLLMHHSITDGWSMNVFVREIATLYTAFANKQTPELPELRIQYPDFAVWQREQLQGELLDTLLSYWKRQLEDCPPLRLPTDRPHPAVQTFLRGATQNFTIAPRVSQALRALSQQEGVSLFMTLLAAFKTLLHRYTGQDEILLGTPIAGRSLPETADLLGCFVNTLALRTDLSGNPSFRELLGRVRDVCLSAYAHQDLPFERIVKELRPDRSLRHNPLVQVLFVLQEPLAPLEIPGLTITPLDIDSRTAKFDMTMSIVDTPDVLTGSLEYNTDLFDATTITRLLGHFQTLLEGIAANPDQRVAELPLLTATERRQLLVDWNATTAPYPEGSWLHQLVEEQAARTPDATAIIFGDQKLSYRELNRRANQLAHYLQRQHGVCPDVMVALYMQRSLELVVGLLGILKAGGAYVPLDPIYPGERLHFMLADAGAQVVITQSNVDRQAWMNGNGNGAASPISKQPLTVVDLDTTWSQIAQEPDTNPTCQLNADNLAYVIYTSGSSGQPKGAAITHRGSVVLVDWARNTFSADELAGVLASTSICFDLSIFELFVPLSVGGRVILAEHALQLPQLAAKEEVTLINTVPSVMAELLRDRAVPQSVRTVNLAGEPLRKALAQQLYLLKTISKVFNLYGPSEDTTYSTYALIGPEDSTEPAIGRPIANTRGYVLDPYLQPAPIGVPGELYLGGDGLARGYLSRPELTAERFIPDPFAGTAQVGARLYRTGDSVRHRHDGMLEFLGRVDHQVKVRGYRVEPGEIENVLEQHPSVRECVVVVSERAPNDTRLVAYVVPAEEAQVPAGTPQSNGDVAISATELRTFLKAKLPEYMIPSAFVSLKALPLTPNGKINRQALPRPDTSAEAEAEYAAPRTPVEEQLTAIWTAALKRSQIGIHDNFFTSGGHSLLATRVILRIRSQFKVDLRLNNFFERPTIAGLAEYIETLLWATQSKPTSLQAESSNRDEGII